MDSGTSDLMEVPLKKMMFLGPDPLISMNDGNGNMFPFPLTFGTSTDTHNNSLLENLETETCFCLQ